MRVCRQVLICRWLIERGVMQRSVSIILITKLLTLRFSTRVNTPRSITVDKTMNSTGNDFRHDECRHKYVDNFSGA